MTVGQGLGLGLEPEHGRVLLSGLRQVPAPLISTSRRHSDVHDNRSSCRPRRLRLSAVKAPFVPGGRVWEAQTPGVEPDMGV